MRISALFLAALVSAVALARWSSAAGLDPHVVAKHVDELLAKEVLKSETATAPAQIDDPMFLRRAALDLVGSPPTPAAVTAYTLDPSSDKRARAVDRLLADPAFGENWARYWRDVILYRRSEDRALLVSPAVVDLLTTEFNKDSHWDAIARQFITATGDVRTAGATAIVMAQMGNPEDTTAEVSRIFMGIQIQCAQCHNHPTDRWKREQFHELAAFFPRIAVRPVREGEKRSFAIVSVDRGREGKNDKPNRGSLEHYMPDLNHSEAEGKLMKPVFFVTGQHLDKGLKDQERREKIAEWITAPGNRWFAKAYVNRMWSELVGRGFYEPVDDIGPDRSCAAPHTLDYLAERFAASHYDVKWLMRVITSTQAYGWESKPRTDAEETPLAGACPQRLRGDQLYNAIVDVLGIPESADPRAKDNNYRAALGSPRGRMNQTFGYDPSTRRDEVAGSIPQALFLMNAPEVTNYINARNSKTSLAKLLTEIPKDEDLVTELYLKTLAREPKESERHTCLDYVRTTGNRAEAFEDILWALVNSTEFLNRK